MTVHPSPRGWQGQAKEVLPTERRSGMRDPVEEFEATSQPWEQGPRVELHLVDYIDPGAVLVAPSEDRCRHCGPGEVVVAEVDGFSNRPLVLEWCPNPSCGCWC